MTEAVRDIYHLNHHNQWLRHKVGLLKWHNFLYKKGFMEFSDGLLLWILWEDSVQKTRSSLSSRRRSAHTSILNFWIPRLRNKPLFVPKFHSLFYHFGQINKETRFFSSPRKTIVRDFFMVWGENGTEKALYLALNHLFKICGRICFKNIIS